MITIGTIVSDVVSAEPMGAGWTHLTSAADFHAFVYTAPSGGYQWSIGWTPTGGFTGWLYKPAGAPGISAWQYVGAWGFAIGVPADLENCADQFPPTGQKALAGTYKKTSVAKAFERPEA